MKQDMYIKNGIIIPEHELIVTFSRAGGPGGQHVNKTETRVTISWNIQTSAALSDEQKNRIMENLKDRITIDGNIIIHNNESRSQQQNKENAYDNMASLIRKALHVPKKRMKTRVSKAAKEARLQAKTKRSTLKKLRSKKNFDA